MSDAPAPSTASDDVATVASHILYAALADVGRERSDDAAGTFQLGDALRAAADSLAALASLTYAAGRSGA